MTAYRLGDGVPLEYRAYVDGVLTDVSAVLTLVNPQGTPSTPTPVNDETGVYTYVVPTSDSGTDVGPWLFTWAITGALTDVQGGSFYVSTTGTPVYGGLDKLKRRRKIPVDDTNNDDDLMDDLDTASRMIEDKTGRLQFWLAPAVTQRVYDWRRHACRWSHGRWILETADFATPDGLVVEYDATGGYGAPDWRVISAGAYEAYRDEDSPDTWPYEGVLFYRGTLLPWAGARMRVTARPGWPVVPPQVDRAALILAARYGARDASPEGVISSQEWGGVRVMRWDPDVEAMLANLTREAFA